MKHSIVKRAISVAHRSVVIALFGAFLLAVAGMIERSIFESWSRQIDARLQRASHIANQISLFDERLSMFANMAVASSDWRWVIRYENAAPLLGRAIADATAMAPDAAAGRFATYGKIANDATMNMERQAMGLVQKGQKSEAEAILNSRTYATEKATLASETGRLVEATRQSLQSDFFSVVRFSQLSKFCLVLIGIGILWAALYRNLRRSEDVFAEAEDDIRYLAMHDELTGLGNRRSCVEVLNDKLHDISIAGRKLALIAIDMAGFRKVNSLYGHVAGDTILVALAKRLRADEDSGTSAFRVGGDEFVVLSEFANDAELEDQCNTLIRHLEKPIAAASGTISLNARLGIAKAPQDATDPQSLYRKADIALQQARSEQAEGAVHYNTSMDDRIRSRARIETELPGAIERGFIVPYFQPVVELSTGRLVGFEALARWEHPDQGLIAPDAFISVAEEAGLIDDLFFAILQQACANARMWPQHLSVSVNLSPTQLANPNISSRIRAIVEEAGISPGRLEIEITENALAANFTSVRQPLTDLRKLGISIALDDFGTGYSSMQHLSELLINKIKIDKSFIRPSVDPQQNAKIVRSMLGLAASLGMKTTAEGIEQEEQAAELHRLGCAYGQGYLYSRPVSRLACLAMIERWSPLAARQASTIREVG
ncbi:putative bifunctional diguanylate cyclase/phosphodiesterase [Taklimakanibacter lacteus]|uniref:putative bifunctional diguanylate cyclase/phosphodiesterase n=1 Tax=Taklimakanibacter lacteus TaxID=2268456 RepID=UPI000E6711B6